ncbi:MAG: hypothetical protein HY081_05780 [Gammaproteobacteria bacterium]|nr:hypothetical protein [Gammaproteobacteria bacterium]
MVSFGNRYRETTRKGKEIEVGDYALHIQCAWRLARSNAVVVGFADYVAAEDEAENVTKIYNRLREEFSKSPIVKEIPFVRGGAFSLALEDGLYLEAFPSFSAEDPNKEFWRIFRPKWPSPHFVVTPAGVEHDG